MKSSGDADAIDQAVAARRKYEGSKRKMIQFLLNFQSVKVCVETFEKNRVAGLSCENHAVPGARLATRGAARVCWSSEGVSLRLHSRGAISHSRRPLVGSLALWASALIPCEEASAFRSTLLCTFW